MFFATEFSSGLDTEKNPEAFLLLCCCCQANKTASPVMALSESFTFAGF